MCFPLILAALTISVGPGDDLEQARNRARAEANAEVVLQAGIYRLKSTLKFTAADSGVVWRAAEGARVEIVGGVEIPAAAFTPWSGGAGVMVADLSAYPVEYWKDRQREFTLPLPVPEMFVDGRRMTVAAWPNGGGFTEVGKIVDGGTRVSDGSPFNKVQPTAERRGATFLTPQTRPFAWKNPGSTWLHGYWCFDWYDSVIPGAAFARETNGMTKVTLAHPHCYGMKDAAHKAPRRWRAIHLLEELDAPGEYYVDREAKKLYFMPEHPLAATSRIVVTSGERPLFSLNSTTGMVFRGISFSEGFGMALKAHKCSGVRLERCRFSNLRTLAAEFTDCTACRVSDCEVTDTGTGGISMAGGDRRTLTRGENVIERSVFRRFSTLRPVYTPGVRLGGCGNTVRYCEITDTPHMAAGMSGNDNVFEHCVISNACTCSDDAAAFYKGRNPSCTGNVIRHCLFSDIGSVRRHGNAAIYFDDGDCGERVEHCTFRRVLSPARSGFGAVFCHGGYSNVVSDCVFEDCERPLGYSKWKQERWLQFIGGVMYPYMMERLKKTVDVESPLYQERYPFLRGFMAGAPEESRCNVAVNCEFRNCRQPPKGHWALVNCRGSVIEDPRIFRGDANTAYRDPAVIWHDGVFHLYFTLVETEADKTIHSYVAQSESKDLKVWTKPEKITPKSVMDYSSPGNVVRDGDEWVLCYQSYPRPGNVDDGKIRYGNATARLFIARSRDLRTWSAPELLRVKGPAVAEKDMGRMIDPYLIRGDDGHWRCFYKQSGGVSFSKSADLRVWEYAGHVKAGENACVVKVKDRYVMVHSPANGLGFKTSLDLENWQNVPGTVTLGQDQWPWARGRLTAGCLLDARKIPGFGKWLLFFHGSGPESERRDFDRNASVAVVPFNLRDYVGIAD